MSVIVTPPEGWSGGLGGVVELDRKELDPIPVDRSLWQCDSHQSSFKIQVPMKRLTARSRYPTRPDWRPSICERSVCIDPVLLQTCCSLPLYSTAGVRVCDGLLAVSTNLSVGCDWSVAPLAGLFGNVLPVLRANDSSVMPDDFAFAADAALDAES